MEILITNDDGWGAKGILTLVRILTQLGHVTVVAPDGARSGMSNAITVAQPIYLRPLNDPNWGSEEWQKNATIYTTNGTPSDCVKLAIDVVFNEDSSKIDLLVSGINHGSNAGINVIYSGTMGACFVGAEHGIPSIGYSIDDHNADADFSHMEKYILELTRHLIEEKMPYNVSFAKNVVIFAFGGIVIAIGIIFVSMLFDNTVKSQEEVERLLGVPVIAVIPKMEQ
jgi:5'-nucleotidase